MTVLRQFDLSAKLFYRARDTSITETGRSLDGEPGQEGLRDRRSGDRMAIKAKGGGTYPETGAKNHRDLAQRTKKRFCVSFKEKPGF